jgi:hypothetical protein
MNTAHIQRSILILSCHPFPGLPSRLPTKPLCIFIHLHVLHGPSISSSFTSNNSCNLVYLRHSGYVNQRTEKRGHSWCLTQVLVSVLRSIFNLRLCAASLYFVIADRSGSGCYGTVERLCQWQPHPSE